MNLSISCTRLAGHIAHFLQNWKVLIQDQWVLQTVGGYQLDLLRTPHQYQVPNQIKTSQENSSLVTLEVTELLSKGAIVETQLTPHSFISQIFLVEKKDGGQRPVINLKGLNQFVRVEHFKMEGLHLLPDFLQSVDWMVKMDLKDAYLQVPINPGHQPLLSFLWEEKYYMFTCLPFGLSAAPRVFTKLLKPVVGFLRQVGCRLIIYLDNLLFLHQDKDRLRHMVQLISQLFEGLGLMVNLKKSILLPAQNLGFLGFNINSQTMQISLPQEKMRKIQQDSSRLLAQQSVSVRQIAQFVDKTTATLRALPTAPLHYRALQFLMNSVAPVNYTQEGTTDKFNTIVQLDPESKTDLTWWSSLNRKDLLTPVIPPAPSVTIESDASNQGWGAVLEGQTRTGGVWTAEEATHHINYLELLAAFLAIKVFGKDWRDSSLTPYGQYNSSFICQSQGRYNLSQAVQTSHHDVDLVHFSEHHIDSRTPSRPPQCDSRPGIVAGQELLRLDAQSPCLSEDSGEHGTTGGRSVCLSPDKATTTLLQLEGRPRGSSHRCIHAGLVSPERIREPTLVPDQSLPLQGDSGGCTNSTSNTVVKYTTLVSCSTGTVGGLPSPAGQSTRFGSIASGSGVPNETGSSSTDRLAYLRQSYSSQGLSSEASDLMLASWRDKTNSNYGSSFAKWAGLCQQRGRNPLSGPVADVVNFLAELFSQGYQYQSLNCYRSAISSAHEKVDGNSIGVHQQQSQGC